jgi:hypothetical protein
MPGGLATITVAFAPTEARDYRAKLIVNSNAGANEVEVSGKGLEGTPLPAAPAAPGAPKPPEPPAPAEGRTEATAEDGPPAATESTSTTTRSTRKEEEDRP